MVSEEIVYVSYIPMLHDRTFTYYAHVFVNLNKSKST